MSSPFPGMDPYLQDPEYWRSFHHHLSDEIARQLNPQIVPKYFADVEVRTTFQNIGITIGDDTYPDVGLFEVAPKAPRTQTGGALLEAPIHRAVELPQPEKLRAVQIYERETQRLVTSIKILSPVNKGGEGLHKYQQKRLRILRSDVHLVEIDLLRRGQRPGVEVKHPPLDTDYVLVVNRAQLGNQRDSEIWPLAISSSLPSIPIPLLPPDTDAILDLARFFDYIYNDFYYAIRIDYKKMIPPPELHPAMKTWMDEISVTKN